MTPAPAPHLHVLLSPFQNAFFAELADVVVAELQVMGVTASVLQEPEQHVAGPDDVFVLLPPHEWVTVEGDAWLADDRRAARTIGIGAEQPGSIYFDRNAAIGARIAHLFDFSERAVTAFRTFGVDARHLPFGHTAHWDRFRPEGQLDGPDVVFMGNFKARRLDALGGMAAALGRHRTHLVLGDNTAPNTGSSRWFVAGDDKRSLLASSKVLLNIHQSDEPYFEWLRFTEAALCGAVVLTEPSTHSDPYVPGEHFLSVPLAEMADALDDLLAHPASLAAMRLAAFEAVRAHPFSNGLRSLVAAAEELLDLPVPGPLPARTRREAFAHQHAIAPAPPRRAPSQATSRCRTELFVVGDAAVTVPARTGAGDVQVVRVTDAAHGATAMRASHADAVALITRPAEITPVGMETLQQLVLDGAPLACGMTAERIAGRHTLRGLWQPDGTSFDPTSLDDGWFLARPSAVAVDGRLTAPPQAVRHAPMPVFVAATPSPHGVAVVMATFNPSIPLFHRQVESLRRQTLGEFTCIVTDDGSDEDRKVLMRQQLGTDARFVFVEHDERVGFYRNFERGLAAARELHPELIALADQDDHWYPTKLERAADLVRSRGADLVFTDVAPVDQDRRLLATSFFEHRSPDTSSVLSLTMMNAAIGATCMFRADLLDVAMPFPPQRYRSFHDHWLARCAQLRRGLVFDPRVSMEYVQHGGNVQGFRAGRPPFREFANLRRAHAAGTLDDSSGDIELMAKRLDEMTLLETRIGTSPGLQRAMRVHRWWLRGSRAAVASLTATWCIDQFLRRRPRHESIEFRYVRAALAASDPSSTGSRATHGT